MKETPKPMISNGPHERRKTGDTDWTPVAIASYLWPKELLVKLEAGETVSFDGYEWKKSLARPTTCGDCCEFFKRSETCGHPMVYLNHGDNTHHTTASTESCGFFYPMKK